MNEFFTNVSSNLLLGFPGFRLYALCAVLLAIKMFAVGFYTARTRLRLKVAMNPEDAARFGAELSTTEHPEVERVLRAHRNDLENIPSFLIVGLIAVLLGVPVLGLQICLIAFTAARMVYSVAYIKGMQPWRSLTFGVGALSMFTLSVMIIIRILA
ncbi:MAPEG family protein [Archangium lansingense]|uniref:Microsomal glutathione S-transferase 1 n=1 Tax=Archangium lansingense TaxID=2995310 RepID=A0ABT4AFN5_9BACT|nr:MAPEG family protein [Archangium lansinium]MCY1080505.1 MAPEG family protein [Archangium lansinium]